MIRVIIFDLGDTLISSGTVLPGVPEALRAVESFTTGNGEPLVCCLGSDVALPNSLTNAAVEQAFVEYVKLLDSLNLRRFFEPVSERVTLSVHAGVLKPATRFFQTLLRRAKTKVPFGEVLFITENGEHIEACRAMGMKTLQFRKDFDRWSQAPTIIANVISGGNHGPNLAAALRPVLKDDHEVKLESIESTTPDRINATGRKWVKLDDPSLGALRGVHVELPVKVDAKVRPNGMLEDLHVDAPARQDLDEATLHVQSLLSNEQISGMNPQGHPSPTLSTHGIETDEKGRRVLVRKRFSAM